MSNSFPSMISNEPPPLDLTSDEEDSEEFRTPGLKLDLSAEPSPLSTPHKISKSQNPVPVQEDYLTPNRAQNEVFFDQSLTNGHDEERNSTSVNSKNNNDSPYIDDNHSPLKSPSKSDPNPDPSKPTSAFEERYPTPEDDSQNTSSLGSPDDEFEDCQTAQQLQLTNEVPLQEKSQHDVDEQSFEDANTDSKEVEHTPEPYSNAIVSEVKEESCAFVEQTSICDSVSKNSAEEPLPSAEPSLDRKGEDDAAEHKPENDTRNSCDLDPISTTTTYKELSSVDTIIKNVDDSSEFHAAEEFPEEFEDFQDFKSQEPELIGAGASNVVPKMKNSSECPKEAPSVDVATEDDFGDFDGFQSSSKVESLGTEEPWSNSSSNNEMKTSYIGAVDVEIEDDDDFGDFSSMPSIPIATNLAAPVSSQEAFDPSNRIATNAQNDKDDEFADFENFKPAPISQSVQPSLFGSSSSSGNFTSSIIMSPRGSADYSAALESKFENVVKTMIPLNEPSSQGHREIEDSQSLRSLDKELKESKDSHWTHVKDFEESKGLLYKWLNSQCQQKLYKSLNIDTSTIVYTEKWGAIEVPRFAASMVETPLLQPQVCPSTSRISEHSEHLESETRPKTSALEDNHMSSSTTGAGKKPLSKDAQQILQQLPDISFMRAKTLVFPQAAAPSSSLL